MNLPNSLQCCDEETKWFDKEQYGPCGFTSRSSFPMRERSIFPNSARMKDLSLWSDVLEYASCRRATYSSTLGKLPSESRRLAGTSFSDEPDLTFALPKLPVIAPDVRKLVLILERFV